MVPDLPIFSILDSIDFADHLLIVGDVGSGKSTVTPIHEYNLYHKNREIVIREPSRASCNALFYSLCALHPELKEDFAVITKDTKINAEKGRIKIVTDGVLLRMLAEDSLHDHSIYFDESHQMTSQLELCMSLAKRKIRNSGNLIRIMSATLDPKELLSFLGIKRLYTLTGKRYPVKLELEHAKDLDEMFLKLSMYLGSERNSESWLVFLPTRRLVEKYAYSYGGTYIHGGLEGSEINKIQERAEVDKTLKIFATNVIASSVNIYLDNVLIFNETIESKDELGQKKLEYQTIDHNLLLQMIGRVGRFKPGRAVILTDAPLPKVIKPVKVKKALESETPFDLVLLMSKYGLHLSELEFMSKLDKRELDFAEKWLEEVGAIDSHTKRITEKGLLMTEIPYEPDYANMIASAIIADDYDVANFLLAAGSFGDSLNHSYRSDMEVIAKQFLYEFDKTSELSIKAHLLKKLSEDKSGAFVEKLMRNGIFVRFVDEAFKNFEAAIEALNDILVNSGKEKLSSHISVEVDTFRLQPYLADCLTFEKFGLHEKREFDLRDLDIRGSFFARSLTMNYRKILYDVIAMNPS